MSVWLSEETEKFSATANCLHSIGPSFIIIIIIIIIILHFFWRIYIILHFMAMGLPLTYLHIRRVQRSKRTAVPNISPVH